MRDSHTKLVAAIAMIGAAWIFSLPVRADPQDEAGKNLPTQAKAVALKFELYRETATAQAVEEKRKQVIDYLGELLKKEAAAANLDGALAIKGLIQRLEAEAPSQRAPGALGTAGDLKPGREGLPLNEFSIASDATRRLEFRFAVGRDSAAKLLRCEITGASDDSGDRGLDYQLIDPRGKVVKQGSLKGSGRETVSHQTRIGGEWILLLVDADTALDGEFPGNDGSVRIAVVRGQAALASNRHSR